MINFAHAFWYKPLLNKKFNDDFELSLKTTMLNYAFSTSLIHKFGYKITLYADKDGADLLSFIDYDNVIVLDVPENNSIHFAAMIKFMALKKMTLNDVLIDGDIFLRKQEIYDIIEYKKDDVVYSVFEENSGILRKQEYVEYYTKLMNILENQNFDKPYHNFKLEDICFPNTSVLKFNNQTAKDEYIKQYEKHFNYLNNIDFGNVWPDIIIEQYFLKLCCDYNNYTHSPLLEDFVNNEDKAKKIGFSHLGPLKYEYNVMCRMELYFTNEITFKNLLSKYREITGKIM